mmetsp:Transcript_15320/g.20552  ORF Transcript_15320/g.20552 Transcript_15320/m.20552 type:complete len:140 (-) Transcript_15320:352-771(-)
MVPMMVKRFADVGITYSMGGDTGNTLDSHRISAHALRVGGEAMQDALMEELFLNYFSEEKFLGDKNVLLAAAEKAQVPRAQAVLDDPNQLMTEVKEELSQFARGVSGVPFFIVDGKYKLSGAQPPETFSEIFEEISEEL